MPRKQETFSSFVVRLPARLKAFIEAEAAKNCSSQNSEIVRCIVARMEREGAKDHKPASAAE
jgi:hypothetical protein